VETTQLRGFDLAYEIDGQGNLPPLIWGHGLTRSVGISAAYPLVDLAAVTAQRTVVRYDARGHGMSSILEDPTKGSWVELAADQSALIDHLGFDQVAVGGVSMGAGTALHNALALGTRVERLVLVIPPTGWEERAAQVDRYEKMARFVEKHDPKALLAVSAELPPPDPFVGTTDYADRQAGSYGTVDAERMAANFRGAVHADLPPVEALAKIEAPTLVLAWSGDDGHPVSTAERLGENLPNVQVSIATTRAEFDTWSQRLTTFLAD